MGYPTKIATCCHCGTKAALKLEKGRHELSCASCGAPLRDLKMLPRQERRQKPAPAISHAAPLREFRRPDKAEKARARKPKPVKRRGRWFKKLAEEVFDVIEDVFD